MAVTARIIIVQLLRLYRDQLSPRAVAYLEQCLDQDYPPGRAKNLLPLVQATLKQLVTGYHAQTSSAGWTQCGPRLAETEIQHAEGYGYCTPEIANGLRRQVKTCYTPSKLLELIATTWAASDKKSRPQKQAA